MLWIILTLLALYLAYIAWKYSPRYDKLFGPVIILASCGLFILILHESISTNYGTHRQQCVSNISIQRLIDVTPNSVSYLDSTGQVQTLSMNSPILFKNLNNPTKLKEYKIMSSFKGGMAKFFFGSYEFKTNTGCVLE